MSHKSDNSPVTQLSRYICGICPQRDQHFRTTGSLMKHMMTHFAQETYARKLCDKNSDNSPGTELSQYICGICPKHDQNFRSTGSLRIHMMTHFAQKTYARKLCDKKSDNSPGTEMSQYICGIGPKHQYFRSTGSLIKHMMTHFPQKTYARKLCDKKSDNSPGSEMSHYLCGICPKHDQNFRSTGSLMKHLVAHFAQKTYARKLCDKKFTQASSLKAHMVIQSGE